MGSGRAAHPLRALCLPDIARAWRQVRIRVRGRVRTLCLPDLARARRQVRIRVRVRTLTLTLTPTLTLTLTLALALALTLALALALTSFYGAFVAVLTAVLSEGDAAGGEYRRKLDKIQQYMSHHNMCARRCDTNPSSI